MICDGCVHLTAELVDSGKFYKYYEPCCDCSGTPETDDDGEEVCEDYEPREDDFYDE